MLKRAFYTPNLSLRHPKSGEVIRGERRKYCQYNYFPESSSADESTSNTPCPEVGQALRGELRAQIA